MALTTTNPNNVRVYNVTGRSESALPSWVVQRNKRKLKRDTSWTQRIDLVQDLEFPQACTNLQLTQDSKYIIATGTYKPQLKVYDLDDLSLKFSRHTRSDTVQMQVLSEDWKKIALLQSDRWIEFHTQFGLHFSTRIPRFGRDLAYMASNCDLYTAGVGNEIYRLNLEEGKFKKPFETSLQSINQIRINPVNELIAVGGEDGIVEMWDYRCRKSTGSLLALQSNACPSASTDITALSFFPNDGISLAVGSAEGQVLMFDLRMSNPTLSYDHNYQLPIRQIYFHESSNNVISVDSKSVRLWNKSNGKLFTFIEPTHSINSLLTFPRSGLFMAAVENSLIETFFIPSLGPAPSWCSFLENVTEELEENPTPQTWDNFKFVTKEDLQSLGLEHLLSSDSENLKPYMHGYFLDYAIWRKANLSRAAANADEIRKEEHDKKLRKLAGTRISSSSLDKKRISVNKQLATKLSSSVANDKRFTELFEDEDFEIDTNNESYQLVNHSSMQTVQNDESRNRRKMKFK